MDSKEKTGWLSLVAVGNKKAENSADLVEC